MIKVILTVAISLLLLVACDKEPSAQEIKNAAVTQANFYAEFMGGKVVRCTPEKMITRYGRISCIVTMKKKNTLWHCTDITDHLIVCGNDKCSLYNERKYGNCPPKIKPTK